MVDARVDEEARLVDDAPSRLAAPDDLAVVRDGDNVLGRHERKGEAERVNVERRLVARDADREVAGAAKERGRGGEEGQSGCSSRRVRSPARSATPLFLPVLYQLLHLPLDRSRGPPWRYTLVPRMPKGRRGRGWGTTTRGRGGRGGRTHGGPGCTGRRCGRPGRGAP